MSDQHLIGTELNDVLEGGEGNDTLDGGPGWDTMLGGAGNDYYIVDDGADVVVEMPGEGVDTVESWADTYILPVEVENLVLAGLASSGTGNDSDNVITGNDAGNVIAGRAGNDTLLGGAGNDYLSDDGDGDDFLDGGSGSDFLTGGGGNDTYLPGLGGQDTVFDPWGIDALRLEGVSPDQVERIRESGTDHLLLRVAGTGESVTIYNWFSDPIYQIESIVFDDGTVWDPATSASLRYFGTAGDDFLQTTDYGELLEGRGGNDTLLGSGGDDVYAPGVGGNDIVFDYGGDDELRLDGVSADEVERVRTDGSNDLVLRVTGTGDVLTIASWFSDPIYQIERLVFDDGTVWDPATSASLRYFGTAGDDFLQTTDYGELLEGRGGNDTLLGSGGDDVYAPGVGGNDIVFDYGGDDELRLDGVSADEIERVRTDGSNDLVLRAPGTGDVLTIASWFSDPIYQIERLVFDDGTVWDPATSASLRYFGTAGDDFLQTTDYGELLEGRGGNDTLLGSGGDDVYAPGVGGNDIVFDYGGDDELRLDGVSADEIERVRTDGSNDLVLRAPGTGDVLTIASWFSDPIYQIERLVFDDGTVWDPATSASLRYFGTAESDILFGSEHDELMDGRGGNDQLNGGWGNDTLVGGEGDDFLLGGAGDDHLYGGIGWDSYYFDPSSGSDTVFELDEAPGDQDWAIFGWGIAAQDLVVSRDGDDLVLEVSSWTTTVRFSDWFDASVAAHVEVFSFQQDGSLLTDEQVEALINDAPVVAAPMADQIAQEDVAFSFTVPAGTFFDPNPGDVLAYAASLTDGAALPAWLSFDAGTQTFSGMQPGGATGELSIRVTATDGDGLSASDDFVLALVRERTFSGTEGDDTLTGTAGQDVIVGLGGDDFLFGVAGHDQLLGGAGGDWMVADTGDDTLDGGSGQDELYGGPGSDTYLFARGTGADYAWELAAGNPGDVDILQVASDIAPAEISVRYVPSSHTAWNDGGFVLSIAGTADSMKLVWSPTTGPEHEIEQVVFGDGTVWDETVLAALAIANGSAPALANPLGDQAAEEDQVFSWTVPGDAFSDSDIVIGDSLAYAASLADGSALPSWLSFDPVSQTFSGTPQNADVGTLSVRVEATDESARSASDTFDLTVLNANDAPVVAVPIPDQEARDTLPFLYAVAAATFVDEDAGDSFVYEAALADGSALPSWLAFDAMARTFSGTPGAADIGTLDVRITATDGAGAQASDVFAVVVAAAPDQLLMGTSGNDVLSGASGSDTLDGLGGSDTMSGGLGDDVYYVAQSGDLVIESEGAGVDTVYSSITYTLGAHVENLTLTGGSNRNATGNDLDNVLAGNSGRNTLSGGAGNDTYIVTQGNDTVAESTGEGVDTVRASISYTLGSNVENLVLTGAASLGGTGNALDNWLTGNDGANLLRGRGGDDALSGGAGDDTLTGGTGSDAFYFEEAPGDGGVDRITDFDAGERIWLEDGAFAGIGAEGLFAPGDERFFAAAGASGGADDSDRVVYDTAAGMLYYDADGSGAEAPTLIAVLDNRFALSATDIGVS